MFHCSGTQPILPDRVECEPCVAGYFSPYGVCSQCEAGKQSTPARTACVGCQTVGAEFVSLNGSACQPCEAGKQPVGNRTKCEDCEMGRLGQGGLCYDPCETLGCTNQTMIIPIHQQVLTVPTIDDLCSEATAWTASGAGEAVFVGTNATSSTCTDINCSLQSPQQVRIFNITGVAPRSTGICVLELNVLAARIEVTPAVFTASSLSTSFRDTIVTVQNTGGVDGIVFAVTFDASWISVERVDFLGVGVTFPQTLSPGEHLVLTVRTSGTTAEPGTHVANGTITSNVGDETIQVTMEVEPANLRIVALPAVLATATLSAGLSTSTYVTLYNLHTDQVQWTIDSVIRADEDVNCSIFGDLSAEELQLTPVSFSDCGGTDSAWLSVGGQLQVEMKLTAPRTVGEYTATTVIVGTPLNSSLASSTWNVQSTIRVTPSDLVPASSAVSLGESIIAGTPSPVLITARDQYGNEINVFGLEFIATATPRDSAGALSGVQSGPFNSGFNAESSLYYVAVTLTVGTYNISVSARSPDGTTNENVGDTLIAEVQEIVCSEQSRPSDDGNMCICNEGFARQLEECAVCPAGSRPRPNREDGCITCNLVQDGTAAPDGLECNLCPIGFGPNTDFSECVACGPNQYFSLDILACRACDPGMQLLLDFNMTLYEQKVAPCGDCPPFYAGVDGTCTVCPDGKEPTADARLCVSCPTSMAGTRGECFDCEPGRYQKEDQSTCLLCPPGRYRNNETQPECSQCYEGMESDVGSLYESACRCPIGEYDLWDPGMRAAGEGWKTYEDKAPAAGFVALINPFSSDCTLFEQQEPYDGSQSDKDLGIRDDLGPVTRYFEDPYPAGTTNPDGTPLHQRPKRDAAAKEGCTQSWVYDIPGNPIWCFPDGRSAVPTNIVDNKLPMNDIKAERRCITCPDCMDCEYEGYRGIPYIREGFTFVNKQLLVSLAPVSWAAAHAAWSSNTHRRRRRHHHQCSSTLTATSLPPFVQDDYSKFGNYANCSASKVEPPAVVEDCMDLTGRADEFESTAPVGLLCTTSFLTVSIH